MLDEFQVQADAILKDASSGQIKVPGVVAMVTDRHSTVYEGAAGYRNIATRTAATTSDVFALFSMTKAITATAVLQLYEQGLLDLDAPAANYVPQIGKLQVLERFDENGDTVLRPPKRAITTRMLMSHTAGFGYDFFNHNYKRLALDHGHPSVISATKQALMSPLLFDPGEGWEYGSSLDWCGQIVEAITGNRLGEVFQSRIFEPLGITDTTFEPGDAMRQHLTQIYTRDPKDSSLAPLQIELPAKPEVHMGGHGLYGTVEDYMRFIRMWLNDGRGEFAQVLKPETVQMAAKNQLGDRKLTPFTGVIPELANDAEFFPGQSKSWALSFMVNDEDAPTGRPANSLGWAGLANLFYWIDRKNGCGGVWATQIFPFGDAVSFGAYMDFETAWYRCARFKPSFQ